MRSLFDIIYEDADLLAVHKPADLVCHPTKGDEYSSLVSRARLYLKANPHLIHRLDRETSGLVLIAKNPTTARELGKIWETRSVHKEYLAIVHGHVTPDREIIDAPLGKDEQSPVAIKDCVRPDGNAAQTEFCVVQRFFRMVKTDDGAASTNPVSSSEKPFSLLRVHPLTGRKHQIRIHLAHLGHPIVGDKIYGGDAGLYLALVEGRLTDAQRAQLILPHHALHASRIRFEWREKTHEFSAPPEPEFANFIPAADQT